MRATFSALFGLSAFFAAAVAFADAHQNWIDRCAIEEIQCSRPIVARGDPNVDACVNRFNACMAAAPPRTAPPPSGGSAGGGRAASGSAPEKPGATTPTFPGGNAPLPPRVETSDATAADEAEHERLRLQANFEAVQTAAALKAGREMMISLNRALEALYRAEGLDIHFKDPDPIPPPVLVPPPARRGRAASSGGVPPATWPKEFSITQVPDSSPTCSPVAAPFGKWQEATPPCVAALGIKIELQLSQENAVFAGMEDETVHARISVAGTSQKMVSFGVRLTPKEGGGDYVSPAQNNRFTHPPAVAVPATSGPWTPFAPSLTCPRHVQTWQILDVLVADIDAAYQQFIKENPQCDPRTGAACYFSPFPQYGARCDGPIKNAR